MNPIIEKYLQGEMDAAESAQFERELESNPVLRAQFEQDRAFFDLLKNQMLRQKIEMALQEEGDAPVIKMQPFTRRGWFWLLLLVLLLAGFWFGRRFYTPTSGRLPAPPSVDTLPAPNQFRDTALVPSPNEAPEQAPEKTTGNPIAQAIRPHSLESYRGGNIGRTPWVNLVEEIWYAPLTDTLENFGARFAPVAELLSQQAFDKAFREIRKLERIEANNDTLLFLKGFCLMQLWEGRAALQHFAPLMTKSGVWRMDLEWYAGLCHLTTGEKEQAVTVFKKISRTPGHRYRAQAQKAVRLLP